MVRIQVTKPEPVVMFNDKALLSFDVFVIKRKDSFIMFQVKASSTNKVTLNTVYIFTSNPIFTSNDIFHTAIYNEANTLKVLSEFIENESKQHDFIEVMAFNDNKEALLYMSK